MTLHLAAKPAKDGGGSTIAGGVRFNDESGANTGPYDQVHILIDSQGNEVLGTTADAADTHTDTTAISFMAVLKQVSKTLQAFAAAGASGIFINSAQVSTPVTGDYTKSTATVPMELPSDQAWKTGMSNKVFAAVFSTLTRPANQTPYSAGDSISDNGTAGSVTALSATVSDTNDDPVFISEILISSTDTGLAGKRIRAYLFNSDPTASSGVGAGDNAAYSQKKAGYIGSFSGVLETGFSDGTVGRLVPSFNDSATAPVPNAAAGGFVAVKPTTGAKTLFIQYQTLDAFTSSAVSTTILGTARGWQARAA